MAAAPGNRYAANTETLSKEQIKKIIDLRTEKNLSYSMIGKELNLSPYTVFKIVKKKLGLHTHKPKYGSRTWK